MAKNKLKTDSYKRNVNNCVNAVTRRDHILLGVMTVAFLAMTYVLAALF